MRLAPWTVLVLVFDQVLVLVVLAALVARHLSLGPAGCLVGACLVLWSSADALLLLRGSASTRRRVAVNVSLGLAFLIAAIGVAVLFPSWSLVLPVRVLAAMLPSTILQTVLVNSDRTRSYCDELKQDSEFTPVVLGPRFMLLVVVSAAFSLTPLMLLFYRSS